MVKIIPFQPHLKPKLPTIEGNVDYQEFRRQLQRIDQILDQTQVESEFVSASLQFWTEKGGKSLDQISVKQIQNFQKHSRHALRCNITRTLVGESYREFSTHLADSPLLQWFCQLDFLDVVKVPAKSTLQRYSNWLPTPAMRGIISQLLRQAGLSQVDSALPPLNLEEPVDFSTVFLDTTCVKANIHIPVDWVLLRDGVRTLMKAVILIRGQGLKHRMEEPESFLRQINQQCMKMTFTRRQSDGKKTRKKLLRQIKQLVKRVRFHAKEHKELLEKKWMLTEWTQPQAQQIIGRIDGVLELLPEAQKQAHERIIGERKVKNSEKILSLYEPDVHVVVRGKADAEVEFGNVLLLAENPQGLIVDWKLWKEQAPGDAKMVAESLDRINAMGQSKIKPRTDCSEFEKVVNKVGADRGFDSRANRDMLDQEDIYNAISPRSPAMMRERLEEEEFCQAQRRRAQTEGRIGIFKRQFLGQPLRVKGFVNREMAVSWGVLAHNLWVLARLPERKAPAVAQAA
jgi:hypothetical protein